MSRHRRHRVAGVSVDKGRFLIETHLRTGRPIAELAAAHGVHRSWLYKLLARYRAEGDAGLEPRSRRPHDVTDPDRRPLRGRRSSRSASSSPTPASTPAPQTIHYHLRAPARRRCRRYRRSGGSSRPGLRHPPAPQTAEELLASASKPTCPTSAGKPTSPTWTLADGTDVEILNIIDDHSRLCVASRAFVRTRPPTSCATFTDAAEHWGYPASLLTDNGAIFTASHRGGTRAMEPELLVARHPYKHSRPYHPQTCGKVERFHQTLKKLPRQAAPAATKQQLQAQLDRFAAYYNTRPAPPRPRPAHPRRGVRRPRQSPPRADPRIDRAGYRVRHDQIDKHGTRHPPLPRPAPPHRRRPPPTADRRVIMLVAGLDIRILTLDGEPTPPPHPRPHQATTSPPDHADVYDVPRHQSPMSRDITMAPPAGFEPATHGLGNRCSIP